MIRSLALLLVVALATACGGEKLQDAGAKLEIAPAALDFAGVLVRRSQTREVQVRNVGVAPATLTLVEAPAGFRVEPAQVLVQSGTLETLRVIFAPEEEGHFEGRIVFAAQGQGELEVQVRGEGTERALDTELVLDFGEVRLGSVKTLPLDVASLTDIDLGVEVDFTGSDAQAFNAGTGKLSLPPRGTGRLFVQFAPMVRGPHAARLRLEPCPSCAEILVQLKGSGLDEDASVQPSPLDFGTLTPRMTIRREVRVTNRGDTGTWLVDAELLHAPGAPLRLEEQAWPVRVENASTILHVDFAPEVEGVWQATLRLVVAGRPIDIPVIGRAQEPVLRVDPASLDFGVLLPNRLLRRQLVLENRGGDPITIDRLELEGAVLQAFRLGLPLELPFELGDEPVEVNVDLSWAVPMQARGAVLIGVRDRPDSGLRIPLSGLVVEAGSACNLALPEVVRFGLVPLGERSRRQIVLRNESTSTCWLWNFGLEGAGPFRAIELPQGPVSLGPAGELLLDVEYEPEAPQLDGEEAVLRFEELDAGRPEVRIPLRGAAAALAVEVTPDRLDFLPLPVGSHELRAVALRNTGRTPLPLGGVALEATGFLSLAATPQMESLAAGEQAVVQLLHAPQLQGRSSGQLAFSIVGIGEPLLVPVEGYATPGPCPGCTLPVAACPPADGTEAGTAIALVGAASDPLGGAMDCSWSVANGPAGAVTTVEVGGERCTGRFSADRPGRYELRLEVAGAGGTASCTTSVDVFAAPGLTVEASWSDAVDLDLHLLHPEAGPPSDAAAWFGAGDCHAGNPAPGWDGAGIADDPLLERHAQRGPGLERIRLEAPVAGQAYGVGLHFAGTLQGLAAVEGTVSIRCSGEEVALLTETLQALGDGADVGTVTWRADGTCVFTPSDAVVQPAP
ncbi:choice-of-anchor D domain-containing protein [Vulgatibacter sp.]|uniref:choice-of-anchor D domain-containing protein n=1 Tax=Vulgatibacter sp. TaxID=1971226 RepID=UPI0035634284